MKLKKVIGLYDDVTPIFEQFLADVQVKTAKFISPDFPRAIPLTCGEPHPVRIGGLPPLKALLTDYNKPLNCEWWRHGIYGEGKCSFQLDPVVHNNHRKYLGNLWCYNDEFKQISPQSLKVLTAAPIALMYDTPSPQYSAIGTKNPEIYVQGEKVEPLWDALLALKGIKLIGLTEK